MKRRDFIHLTGIGAAASPLTQYINPISIKLNDEQDIIVIGAGTFGVWTAYHLQKKGAKVTLIDAYGPGNSRASSGGETRLIQTNSDNPLYVASAMRSYQLWKQIEEESGHTIVLKSGALNMSTEESYLDKIKERQKQHLSVGITNTEILDKDELRYRWPQMYSDDIAAAMYHDGGASGSILLARKACQVIANQFEQNGGKLIIAKANPVIKNGKISGIEIGQNKTLQASSYVFACGPWLPKLFPEILLPKLKVERRDVLFVGTPPGDTRYSYPNFPEWGINGSGYYGFPDIENRGFKVAPYPDFNSFDPDKDERLVNHYQVKRAHDFVKKRFPGLTNQPIIESRVCQVCNSVDFNFIVDQHPSSQNTWIVGGGSGHGFKHGPAVGEHAAQRILNIEAKAEYIELFKLKEEVFD